MVFFLKILLASSLILISIQDIKDRLVYWFFFPITAILGFLLFCDEVSFDLLILSVIINITSAISILVILYCYIKFKLKTDLNSVFGYGDVLMIVSFAFCFTSETYLVLLVFSFIFSLIINFIKKNKESIPLAGYMSSFFLLVYLLHWFNLYPNLYF